MYKLINDTYILLYKYNIIKIHISYICLNKSEVAQFVQNIPNKKIKKRILIFIVVEFHCGDVCSIVL